MIEESLILSRDRSRILPVFWIVAIVYLIALAIAEVLITYVAPLAGMILHGLIFLALLIQAALSRNKRMYRFLVVLALAPLIRLLSMTLPLIQFQPIYWYVVIGIPLSIAAFLCSRITGLNSNSIGLSLSRRAIPTQLLVGISGLLLGYIEYLILRPEPLVAELSWEFFLLSACILLIFTGLLEEIIFRGMMQTSAIQNLGSLGILYVAVLFAIMHLGYRSLIDVLFVFLVAVVFGFIVHRTGTLAGVSLSHGLTNISLYLIFPFLLASPVIKNATPTPLVSPEVIAPNMVFQVTLTPSPSQTLPLDQSVIPITGSTNEDEEINAPPEPIIIITETIPTFCSPPSSWVVYIVQSGDTLPALSARYGVNISVLLYVNCLEKVEDILVGQQLYVPFMIMPSPTFTPSPTPLATTDLPATQTPSKLPSRKPTSTQPPTDIPTPTNRPKATEMPRPTPTFAPTFAELTDVTPSQPAHTPTPVD